MGATNVVTNEKNHQRVILVVGLGKTGLSCVRYLQEQAYVVRVADSRDLAPGLDQLKKEFPQVQVQTGEFSAEYFCEADEIVLSPGVALSTPAVQAAIAKGATCYGDVELFVRAAQAPIIAVTGSNGKSTLVTLLAEMVVASGKKVGLGGNIGTPVLELLEEHKLDQEKIDKPDFYVLELSSFQLETTTSLNALASIILNVSPDHMDRYVDLKAYAEAKRRVYGIKGTVVVNKDDAYTQKLLPVSRDTITYSVEQEADYSLDVDKQLCAHGRPLLTQSDLKMPGLHNVSNALAALALGEVMKLDETSMVSVLKTFAGLKHRTQFVAEHKGVRWYNDSKGTNVGATCAAVQGMDGKTVLIAGGDSKGADFSELVPVLKNNARAVVLIGCDAGVIEEAIAKQVLVVNASDMNDAVTQAAALAQTGDNILLSPACASFDMYTGYEHRGDVFIEAVNNFVEGDNHA